MLWRLAREPCADTFAATAHRDLLRSKEFEFSARHTSKNIFKFHVLLTTYQALVHDWEHLAHIHWRAVTIDEAHNLRNRASQILQVRDCHRRAWPTQSGLTRLMPASRATVRQSDAFRLHSPVDGYAGAQQHPRVVDAAQLAGSRAFQPLGDVPGRVRQAGRAGTRA